MKKFTSREEAFSLLGIPDGGDRLLGAPWPSHRAHVGRRGLGVPRPADRPRPVADVLPAPLRPVGHLRVRLGGGQTNDPRRGASVPGLRTALPTGRPHRPGGPWRVARARRNLQGLCQPCHSVKTALELDRLAEANWVIDPSLKPLDSDTQGQIESSALRHRRRGTLAPARRWTRHGASFPRERPLFGWRIRRSTDPVEGRSVLTGPRRLR
jgi:hypothetical protein